MPPLPASRLPSPLPSSRTTAGETGAAAGRELVGPPLMSLTCVADGLDHQVSDAALDEAGRSGRYRALCGQVVLPAPLVAAPGPVCRACVAVLAENAQRQVHPGARGWLRRRRGAVR
ncbi:MAG TPA: hypothetical protein VFQ77_14370 [Pseudonocardiaceae bacterium]|nr:hypothetical protein [Pseudonocardiaceae bacterium]